MMLSINGEPREVSATRLSDVLAELGLADARVATAVNGDFVAAADRPSMQLTEGDRVEIVAPQQGG